MPSHPHIFTYHTVCPPILIYLPIIHYALHPHIFTYHTLCPPSSYIYLSYIMPATPHPHIFSECTYFVFIQILGMSLLEGKSMKDAWENTKEKFWPTYKVRIEL